MDTETTEAAPTRRDALEAAFDAIEAPDTPPAEPTTSATPVPETESQHGRDETEKPEPRTAAEKARDDKGRFQRSTNRVPKPKVGAQTTTAPPAQATAAATATLAPGQATPSATALKPPASWKPGAREKWATLPPEVQQEALRRERETQTALSEATEARRNWQAYQQVVAPYAGMIAAEGGNPISAAQNLFQTAAVLRTGAPAHKAQLVARLIQQFGVDINMLASALDGHAPQGQGQQQPQQFRDPRFDAFMQQMESQKQQREAAMAQQTSGEVEDFLSSAEFGEDVRQDMADMLEVAARRGVALSLEDAYTRAVKLHPEVSGVLEQREAAKQANAQVASTQRARVAAVSLKSRPAGPSSAPAPTGRRAQLDAAWEQHNR